MLDYDSQKITGVLSFLDKTPLAVYDSKIIYEYDGHYIGKASLCQKIKNKPYIIFEEHEYSRSIKKGIIQEFETSTKQYKGLFSPKGTFNGIISPSKFPAPRFLYYDEKEKRIDSNMITRNILIIEDKKIDSINEIPIRTDITKEYSTQHILKEIQKYKENQPIIFTKDYSFNQKEDKKDLMTNTQCIYHNNNLIDKIDEKNIHSVSFSEYLNNNLYYFFTTAQYDFLKGQAIYTQNYYCNEEKILSIHNTPYKQLQNHGIIDNNIYMIIKPTKGYDKKQRKNMLILNKDKIELPRLESNPVMISDTIYHTSKKQGLENHKI